MRSRAPRLLKEELGEAPIEEVGGEVIVVELGVFVERWRGL